MNHNKQAGQQHPTVKRILISGYYGFGNNGDEAVLHAIIQALREEGDKQQITIEPIVLSIDPKATERMHHVKSVHRLHLFKIISSLRQCDAVVSGGGSLLQDTTGLGTIPYYLSIIKIAQLLGKPTFIYSQGIGPIRHKWYYPFIRHIFNRSAYISLRDKASVELIEQIGVQSEAAIEVVSDPVMGLPLQQPQPTDKVSQEMPVIGIAVRLWHSKRYDLDNIATALRLILEKRRVHLRFLHFQPPGDTIASQHIIDQLSSQYGEQISVATDIHDPQHMLREVSGCDLLIGMRLHSLIYAAAYGIPMIGIAYDPKVDHFLARIEMEAIGSTEQLDTHKVAEEAFRLLDEKQAWLEEKQHLIAQIKSQSQSPAQHICEYLRLTDGEQPNIGAEDEEG